LTPEAATEIPPRAEVVICGAGIAGIALAHRLTVHAGVRDVLLVDARPPLSLTSDKSTEAYRNWWPGPDDAMIELMNRSIDLLEELARESGNVFRLNRRGYLYATADPMHLQELEAAAARAEALGAGTLRWHTAASRSYQQAAAEGFETSATGADLLLGLLVHERFPFLAADVVGVVHVRRAGWFSGQQLGMHLLEQATLHGTRLVRARVSAIDRAAGHVAGVELDCAGRPARVATGCFVDAAGPHVGSVAEMLGVTLPVFSERHLKASFRDRLGVIPRDAPLLIWEDAQELAWTSEERAALGDAPETRWLLERFPPSVHSRPEGGPGSDNILILWPYDTEPVQPVEPLPESPGFAEVVLRGMSRMVPGLRAYFDPVPRAFIDGGYYTKTRENRFLACPLPVPGAFVIGALSGYGLMAAPGAAEILAAHITGTALPAYASAFALGRYADPEYVRRLRDWGPTGQL
jgi:glycine/D-amino acid oxidase-like deaminating enzyme